MTVIVSAFQAFHASLPGVKSRSHGWMKASSTGTMSGWHKSSPDRWISTLVFPSRSLLMTLTPIRGDLSANNLHRMSPHLRFTGETD
jgi:hypothetical protein